MGTRGKALHEATYRPIRPRGSTLEEDKTTWQLWVPPALHELSNLPSIMVPTGSGLSADRESNNLVDRSNRVAGDYS